VRSLKEGFVTSLSFDRPQEKIIFLPLRDRTEQ